MSATKEKWPDGGWGGSEKLWINEDRGGEGRKNR
jgi:hypothetical protein